MTTLPPPAANPQDPRTILEMLAAHYGVQLTPDGLRIRCPAHGGADPNLSIFANANRAIVVHCHSHQCAPSEIYPILEQAIGQRIRNAGASKFDPDLYRVATYTAGPNAKNPGQQYSEYRRDWPADFDGETACPYTINHQPCGKPASDPHKHTWTTKGSKQAGALALLHHPLTTPDPVRRIITTEGAKAARAIRNAGELSANILGGSNAGLKADWQPVITAAHDHACPIIIWPDNDNPGAKFAYQAGQAIMAQAEQLELPAPSLLLLPACGASGSGDDAADLDPDAIIAHLDQAQPYDPSVAEPPARRGRPPDPEYKDLLETRQAARKVAMSSSWVMGAGKYPKPLAGSVLNCELALAEIGCAADWQFDDWQQRIIWKASGEFFADKTDLPPLKARIEKQYAGTLDFAPTTGALLDAISDLAQQHRTNSTHQRIYAVQWDGTDRLVDFGHQVYGLPEDDELGNAVAALIPRGAVVRALHPGAVFPYMPVIYSPHQGPGKGDSLKLLAPGGYAEGIAFDGFDWQRKAQERTRGVSIVEAAEVQGMHGKELNNAKSFVTDETLRNREAYGREAVDQQQTAIIVGTTNQRSFLTDTDHRRTPVITIPNGQPVNLAWLRKNRQQVWAQCAAEYDAGKWQVDGGKCTVNLPEHLWQAANSVSQVHEVGSPLGDWLARTLPNIPGYYGGIIPGYRIVDALKDGITRSVGGDENGNYAHDEQRSVTDIPAYGRQYASAELSREMQRLGWQNGGRRRIDGGQYRCWVSDLAPQSLSAAVPAVPPVPANPWRIGNTQTNYHTDSGMHQQDDIVRLSQPLKEMAVTPGTAGTVPPAERVCVACQNAPAAPGYQRCADCHEQLNPRARRNVDAGQIL